MCGSTTDRAGTVEDASAEPVEQAVTVPPPQGLDHRADAWAGQLAAALSSALTPSEVLDVLADLGRPLLRAETIDISVLDATGRTLQLVASRRSPEDVERRFASYPVDAPLPTRDALVRRQPVLIPTTRDRDQRYPALRDVVVDQKAWAVLPLICADRVLGTVGLGWTSHQSFPPDQITACAHVAQLCAAALDRASRYDQEHAARAAADRLARRLGELQALTSQLAQATDLATVGDLVVGAGLRALEADAATIGTFDGAHTMTVLATSGLTPDRVARWATVDVAESVLAQDVLTTQQPVVLGSIAERAARYPYMAGDGAFHTAWATLPLVVQDRALGLVAFGWKSQRTFDRHDIDFLTAVAAQAAIALDRALLLGASQQVAETLQRALLPRVITEIQGWDLASQYTPAVEGTQVGGDWYDAFAMPDGRIALVLGDVAGKGIHAAAVMGSVRSATRAYATTDPTPWTVLARLDQYFAAFKPEELVTCFYALLDPTTGDLAYASAGHIPPLDSAADGHRWLDQATTPPLGAGEGITRRQARITIAPGHVLLVYSDGLIECRDKDLYTCMANLARAAAKLSTCADLQESATALIERLSDPQRNIDDIAVLALRRHPPASAEHPGSDADLGVT